MLLLPALLLAQYGTSPGSVCLTGVCGLVAPWRSVPSGLYFVAIGLIGLGLIGLRRRRGT